MKKFTDDSYLLILASAFAITIALTPWVNSDSLIIPKIAILLATSFYMLPRLILDLQKIKTNRLSKVLSFLALAIMFQLLLVIFTTSAPWEQQFYGRTGRGLGFITEFSLLIILLISYFNVSVNKVRNFLLFFTLSCLISSLYSILQRFNLDIFEWNTRTNGIIGTLGNPNFQSSFAAMALVPSIFYFLGSKNGLIKSILTTIPFIFVIFISQSTQGYVASFIAICTMLLVFLWYKNRWAFYGFSGFSLISLVLIIQGMLNNGFLAGYLYKASVISRGEMVRNSFSVAKDNPIFGVGLDSLGDFYLKYKDAKTAKGVNEFTDHAHNIFVNYAATGGFPLAILQFLIVLLVAYVFILLLRKNSQFNKEIAILFSMWVCFQAQALISPANISMLIWNAILSGTLLGIHRESNILIVKNINKKSNILDLTKPFSVFLLLGSLFISYPYFNVDKMQSDSAKNGDGNLAMKSALSFPESTVRYSRIANAFIESNLAAPALELGRAAAKFNPNAPSAWGLILVNNTGTKEERIKAKNTLIKLDPQNKEIREIIIPE